MFIIVLLFITTIKLKSLSQQIQIYTQSAEKHFKHKKKEMRKY